MSASAKIVLRKKPNTKGMFPLAIRITKNRRSTYKHIGHYIDMDDWDEKNLRVKKSHPNAKSLNSLLSSKLTEVNKGFAKNETVRLVYVLPKFSLSNERRAVLELNEKDGERNIDLKLSHRYINNPN